jgi:uncharacterized membrane protein YhaH (DUF805 family)
MKGNVLGFDPDTNTGAISGYDGQRYDFVTAEWRGAGRPRRGDVVDFQAVDQRATEIYLVDPVYAPPGFWQFYFSPIGRISRSQYWLRFWLPYLGIYITLDIIGAIAGQGSSLGVAISITTSILSLVIFWPWIALLVKRLHDRNKAWWWILFYFVPALVCCVLVVAWLGAAFLAIAAAEATADFSIPALSMVGVAALVMAAVWVGVFIWFFIEFGCLRGTIGANRFGPDPVPRR